MIVEAAAGTSSPDELAELSVLLPALSSGALLLFRPTSSSSFSRTSTSEAELACSPVGARARDAGRRPSAITRPDGGGAAARQRSLRRRGSCGWHGTTLIRASTTKAPCGLAITGSRSSSATSGSHQRAGHSKQQLPQSGEVGGRGRRSAAARTRPNGSGLRMPITSSAQVKGVCGYDGGHRRQFTCRRSRPLRHDDRLLLLRLAYLGVTNVIGADYSSVLVRAVDKIPGIHHAQAPD